MKFGFSIGVFMIGCISMAQVGIGTTSPQQDLHVAGTTSTIRIESLDKLNSPAYNDGIRLAPAFVDVDGDISLYGTSGSGFEPLNFLMMVPNFLPDNPYGHSAPYDETGVVVNCTTTQTESTQQIGMVTVTVPRSALLEVKYGVTLYVRGSDMTQSPPWSEPTPGEAIQVNIYFLIDWNSDGLTSSELTDKFGLKGLYYESFSGGIPGHPYMNGQGYMKLPAGTHTFYFYGGVKNHLSTYTSVGFGGAEDYLKIRVFE